MAKVPYGMRSFDAACRVHQRPALSAADRFALIQRAGDAVLARYPEGGQMGWVLNVLEAITDVASNNRPDPESIAILRDAADTK